MSLPAGYEIREMADAEFDVLWSAHAPRVFETDSQIFRFSQFLSDEEKAKWTALRANTGNPYRLNLAVFYSGEFVGWSVGAQDSGETYYMRNSAVLPEHRRKGLYRAMMQRCVDIVVAKGFQKIYSRHNVTNNDVIIPKLQAGFTIASLEMSDTFGVLVHLVYYPSKLRQKVMNYRSGHIKADDELRAIFSDR